MGQESGSGYHGEMGADFDSEQAGYWCVVCGRFLRSDEGVIVHDDIPHPIMMTFDEDEVMQ